MTKASRSSLSGTEVKVLRPDRTVRRGKRLNILAWVATVMSVIMYVSYIDQIRLNLSGNHGSVIQPLAATITCSLWVTLGFLRRPADWPVALASLPGLLLGTITVLTAL